MIQFHIGLSKALSSLIVRITVQLIQISIATGKKRPQPMKKGQEKTDTKNKKKSLAKGADLLAILMKMVKKRTNIVIREIEIEEENPILDKRKMEDQDIGGPSRDHLLIVGGIEEETAKTERGGETLVNAGEGEMTPEKGGTKGIAVTETKEVRGTEEAVHLGATGILEGVMRIGRVTHLILGVPADLEIIEEEIKEDLQEETINIDLRNQKKMFIHTSRKENRKI